jgi:hypothetical protein
VAQNLIRLHLLSCRHFKWRHGERVLALDPQDFAARCQDRDAGTQAQEYSRQRRRRVDDVFAIVENQQKLLSSDGPSDSFGRDDIGAKPQPKRPGHRGRHQVRVG